MYSHDNTKHVEKSTELNEILTARQKKLQNSEAAVLCSKHLSPIGKERMASCGDWLWMLENSSGTQKKLEKGFFCGIRFCPACAWRYSAAWGKALCTIDRYLTAEKHLVPIFVTLTVPNVYADQLRSTLRNMAAAWDKLIRRKRYAAWKSFARKTEITYNSYEQTYHPHFHVMAWVPESYFHDGTYIKHPTLLSDWRASTGIKEIKHVRLQRCISRKSEGAAVAEVAKYVAKPGDYLSSQTIFDGFYEGLHGTRIITLGGEAKKALSAYRRGELMDFMPEKPDALEEYTVRSIYHWANGAYDLTTSESIDLREEDAQRRQALELIKQDMQDMAQTGFKRLSLINSPWDDEGGDMDR